MTKEKKHNEAVSEENNTVTNHSATEDNAKTAETLVENQEETPSAIDPQAEEIQKLREQNQELNEKHLRLFSEFDNFRKRTLKEKIELSKTASAEIITALLPIVDDFERALSIQVENTNEEQALRTGLELIFSKLKTLLNQKGVEEIQAKGKDFDTDYHEAITHIPAPTEAEKGKVIDEVQKGYMLHGKVIRFSKVVVGQ